MSNEKNSTENYKNLVKIFEEKFGEAVRERIATHFSNIDEEVGKMFRVGFKHFVYTCAGLDTTWGRLEVKSGSSVHETLKARALARVEHVLEEKNFLMTKKEEEEIIANMKKRYKEHFSERLDREIFRRAEESAKDIADKIMTEFIPAKEEK